MSSLTKFIKSVRETSKKRTGILYAAGSFDPLVEELNSSHPDLKIIDCTEIYQGSTIFSATELLQKIEIKAEKRPALILNLETFMLPNSSGFIDSLAKMLAAREPLKPLYFLFYAKKIYQQFQYQYELKELNRNNMIEL